MRRTKVEAVKLELIGIVLINLGSVYDGILI